jgi:hypothetical protein
MSPEEKSKEPDEEEPPPSNDPNVELSKELSFPDPELVSEIVELSINVSSVLFIPEILCGTLLFGTGLKDGNRIGSAFIHSI